MRLVGAKIPRVEDRRILTGRGHYIDDVQLPFMLHSSFLRSPLAHGRINSIDVTEARRAPGVVAVYTGEDMKALAGPIKPVIPTGPAPEYFPLVTDKVLFVGDLVAMVVAESRAQAEDACELIEVDYDPLPAVVDYETALDPSVPPIFSDLESNVLVTRHLEGGDVDAAFKEADRVIEVELSQHRVADVPMETRGVVADYDDDSGQLTVHSATQSPQGVRIQLASTLDHPINKLVVLTQDVGGSFGLKINIFREDFCVCVASKQIGRPVKWIEDRNEHMIASGHAREEKILAQVAVSDAGDVLGLKAELTLDQGSYPGLPFGAAIFPSLIDVLLPGPYKVKGYSCDSKVITTNKCVYVAYRGPWAIETWARERLLDIVAHELGLDPAEIRRRNYLEGAEGDQLITGRSVSGITSRETLDRALALIDYEEVRSQQQVARNEGRCVGVGFATFLEAAPGPPEMRLGGGMFAGEQATVKLEADGRVTIITAQSPHGQGHETTLAQVVADEMGVSMDQVQVVYGDTRLTPFSIVGTGGSRAATWATGAVLVNARKVKEKVLAIAGAQLEVSPEDLEISEGIITPKGVPSKAISLAQIARQATLGPASLPPGTDANLESNERFLGEGITGSGWSGGTHACVVEVDLGTGAVKIVRYVVIEDCGRVINPGVVAGQIRGGVAQGIGQVFYERAAYDKEGNFLAGTFMDYLLPTAAEIPTIEIEYVESDPEGEIGFRGVGEGGIIVAPAALTNAIEDALLPFGAKITEMYLPPAKVLELAGIIEE
ncbi:MAG: Carbon-monoxide dehydrogenase (acceptor) [Acidimicrobiaceae bacterium]|nr:Carbon-monoxide dehydrogenase (acceptor) [Acidimicrobiaceae bacterium]